MFCSPISIGSNFKFQPRRILTGERIAGESSIPGISSSTPPKFNMEPENKSLEKESPFGNHYFQVKFGGCNTFWVSLSTDSYKLFCTDHP